MQTATTWSPSTAEHAFHVQTQIVGLKRDIEAKYIALGGLLGRMRDDRLYEALGHPTFESWLADPLIGISRTHAYRVIRMFETYVPLMAPATGEPSVSAEQLAAIGVAKADIVGPLVAGASPEAASEWLAKAETLSAGDLRREVRRASGRDTEQTAWLEQVGRSIAGLGLQLAEARAPRAVLDDIAQRAIGARARLEQEQGTA